MPSLQHVVFMLPALLFTSEQKTDHGSHCLWELNTTQSQATAHKPTEKAMEPWLLEGETRAGYTCQSSNVTKLHHAAFSSVLSEDTALPYGNFSLQTSTPLLWECFQFMNYTASEGTARKNRLRDTRSLNQPPPSFLSSGISQ